MAGKGTRKQAGTASPAAGPVAASSCTPATEAATTSGTAATTERKPRTFTGPQLHDAWHGLIDGVSEQVSAAGFGPELGRAMRGLVDAVADWATAKPERFERIPPAYRSLLGGCFLLALEHLPELPNDVTGMSPDAQRRLSLEVDLLASAIREGDFSRLLKADELEDEHALAAVAEAASTNRTGDDALYTVKRGPNVGQVRPAVIIEHNEETKSAALFVMYKASDVPHEPPGELEAVPRGNPGDPGTWCYHDDVQLVLAEGDGHEARDAHEDDESHHAGQELS